ncbi:MAG: UbiA prenyltransferase family protein [Candidatus Bathyarchaeia archaeon]
MKTFQELYRFLALVEYFKVARVGSWLGWIFSFGFGSIFLSLPPPERFVAILFAFACATASIFILNQYFDRKEDQENVFKSNMPVASGRMAPQTALVFSFLLIILCLVLVVLVDMNLLSLFLIYLVFGTAYSAPPFRLKSVPVVDFVISGLGAGFLPFLIGGGLTDKLISNIPSIMWGAMPLMLIHCGGHIIQAVGDYEADRKTGVHTFVVRYGRKKGVIVAGFMFLIASFSPFVYSAFGLLPYRHLFLFFVLFPLSIPIVMRYADLLKNPSTKNVINIQKTTRKYGIIGVTVLWAYALLAKIASF